MMNMEFLSPVIAFVIVFYIFIGFIAYFWSGTEKDDD